MYVPGISPGCGPSPRDSRQRDTWRCDVCGHVNWAARAKECGECHNARQYTASDLAEQLRPLRIEGAESAPCKWSCPNCTYDNWPRAARCVMCGTAPRGSPIEGAGSVLIEDNMAANKRWETEILLIQSFGKCFKIYSSCKKIGLMDLNFTKCFYNC